MGPGSTARPNGAPRPAIAPGAAPADRPAPSPTAARQGRAGRPGRRRAAAIAMAVETSGRPGGRRWSTGARMPDRQRANRKRRSSRRRGGGSAHSRRDRVPSRPIAETLPRSARAACAPDHSRPTSWKRCRNPCCTRSSSAWPGCARHGQRPFLLNRPDAVLAARIRDVEEGRARPRTPRAAPGRFASRISLVSTSRTRRSRSSVDQQDAD